MKAESLAPVQPHERLVLLDLVRGFAVLGILLANNNYGPLLPPSFDRFVTNVVEILVRGKFYPLFALLFGVGCAIQLERADARHAGILAPYLRRLLFLALIGGVLQFVIEVPQLLDLAVAGVPMLLIGYVLRRHPPRLLLGCALVLCAVSLSVSVPRDLTAHRAAVEGPEVTAEQAAERLAQWRDRREQAKARDVAWSLERLGSRARRVLDSYRALPTDVVRARGVHLQLLLCMLVGMFFWRTQMLQQASARRRGFARLLAVCLPIGMGAAIFANAVQQALIEWRVFGIGPYPSRFSSIAFSPMWLIAHLAMPLAYVAGIALLTQQAFWSRVLHPLTYVGRTALTNYVLQALGPALMFGYYTPGVPLHSLSSVQRTTVLVGLFGLQVVFSRAWLRSYQMGPLEWLWRSLTYWRIQPLRRSVPVETT